MFGAKIMFSQKLFNGRHKIHCHPIVAIQWAATQNDIPEPFYVPAPVGAWSKNPQAALPWRYVASQYRLTYVFPPHIHTQSPHLGDAPLVIHCTCGLDTDTNTAVFITFTFRF